MDEFASCHHHYSVVVYRSIFQLPWQMYRSDPAAYRFVGPLGERHVVAQFRYLSYVLPLACHFAGSLLSEVPNKLQLIPILSIRRGHLIAVYKDVKLLSKHREAHSEVVSDVIRNDVSLPLQPSEDDPRAFVETRLSIVKG